MADVFFIFYFLLEHFDSLKLLIYKFFFFLKLQVILIHLQMIYYFNVLHPQHLYSFFYDPFRVSSIPIVKLNEVTMIPIKPFAFSSIQLAYLFVQFLYLEFESFNPICRILFDFLCFLHFILILFNFFDLIVWITWLREKLLVHQFVNIWLKNFLELIKLVKGFHFRLFNLLYLLLYCDYPFHIECCRFFRSA